MVKRILIANRGEIALRIMRTCREMGLEIVAVASEFDRLAPFAQYADQVFLLGSGPALETYLNQDRLLEVALSSGADAIHPGYGFLSENAVFARRVEEAGLIFVGPSWQTIELMGSKRAAKIHMQKAGVPVVPGYSGPNQDPLELAKAAESVGFPLLIKASAGGGGKGMRVVRSAAAFASELETAKREAASAFGDETVILERYLEEPRHIEFQVFGDGVGQYVHLFERECSIQRRHQKILEEAPSPALDSELRSKMADAAVAAASSVNYRNAGTVEFMLDGDGSFYFLEMNTRLQVEHPITEMITGFDLVRWQILVAGGQGLPATQSQIKQRGHAIEVRIYAEDPAHGFMPQTGCIARYEEPRLWGVRMDSGVGAGSEVTVHYDPMLAKLIAYGSDREEARLKMRQALGELIIHGVKTNIGFLRDLVDHPAFAAAQTTTRFLEQHNELVSLVADDLMLAAALTALGQGQHHPQMFSNQQAELGPWERLGEWRLSS